MFKAHTVHTRLRSGQHTFESAITLFLCPDGLLGKHRKLMPTASRSKGLARDFPAGKPIWRLQR
jgi:hypothetical protein